MVEAGVGEFVDAGGDVDEVEPEPLLVGAGAFKFVDVCERECDEE